MAFCRFDQHWTGLADEGKLSEDEDKAHNHIMMIIKKLTISTAMALASGDVDNDDVIQYTTSNYIYFPSFALC